MATTLTKKATLSDVAKRSGVSNQTVSRVINDHPHVAQKTRARVLSVVAELDYRPNRVARSLATRRTNSIGMIGFGTKYYGPAQMVTNIELALRERGYGLTVATVSDLSMKELGEAVRWLMSLAVDGLVMITPTVGDDVGEITRLCSNIPFIMIDVELGQHVPSAVIDQKRGARLATQHLIDLGHRDICEISGPLTWCDARLRHQGWLETLRLNGLSPGLSIESDWTAAGGYTSTNALLERGTQFSALVVGNDQMALGAFRALAEHGIHVPRDISVVGFDDTPESAYYSPPLTTVQQDFKALGQQSVEHLITLINHPETPLHQRVLYPKLIVRQSTAPYGLRNPKGETPDDAQAGMFPGSKAT